MEIPIRLDGLQLYEGTYGLQALDLVGRKLPMHNGRLLRSFFHEVKEYIEENTFNYNLKETMPHLIKSFGRLQQTTALLHPRVYQILKRVQDQLRIIL